MSSVIEHFAIHGKSVKLCHSFRRSRCNAAMGTASENRLRWLAHLVQQHGGVAALNRALQRGERDATLSQILNKAPNSKTGAPRRMGDKLARGIEQKLGLDHGVMDTEWRPTLFEQGFQAAIAVEPAPLTALEQAALTALRGLTIAQQQEAIAAMERTRDANQRIITELSGAIPKAGLTESQPAPPPRRERPPLKPYPEPFGSVQKEEPAKQGKRTG